MSKSHLENVQLVRGINLNLGFIKLVNTKQIDTEFLKQSFEYTTNGY